MRLTTNHHQPLSKKLTHLYDYLAHTRRCVLHKKHVLHTSLYNGGFVAGAHREDFEHTARCPKQLLIVVVSHDVN